MTPEEKGALVKRILERVIKIQYENMPTPCWIWQGPDSGDGRGGGYGRISFKGMTRAVHLLMFQIFTGRRLQGYQVDHLCNRRRCCNPGHLERVTHLTNQRRRDARLAKIKETT